MSGSLSKTRTEIAQPVSQVLRSDSHRHWDLVVLSGAALSKTFGFGHLRNKWTGRPTSKAFRASPAPGMTAQPVPAFRRPLALVNGASRGLGADLARELAGDHHDLGASRPTLLMADLSEELVTPGAQVTVIGAAARLFADLEWRRLQERLTCPADSVLAEPTKLSEMIHLKVIGPTELTRLSAWNERSGEGTNCARWRWVAFPLDQARWFIKQPKPRAQIWRSTCPGITRQQGHGHSSMSRFHADKVRRRRGISAGEHLGRAGLMASAKVAHQGYAALKSGRPVSVPGAINKLRAAWLCVAPSLRTRLRQVCGA